MTNLARFYHMSIAPRLILRVVRQAIAKGEDWRDFFTGPGPDATWEDYEKQLVDHPHDYLIIGDCDNVGPGGACLGHEKEIK